MNRLFPLTFAVLSAGFAFGDLYLAGDSTMCNYADRQYPQQGWGQALYKFMKDPGQLHNKAIGGRSVRSFKNEGRWQGIVDALKEGDYVIVAFGHNDANTAKAERYSTPDDYKALMKGYAEDVRAKKATIVFATSIPHSGGFTEKDGRLAVRGSASGLGPYVAKTIELAKEIDAPVLDLNGYAVENLPRQYDLAGANRLYMRIQPGEYKNHPKGKVDGCHTRDAGAFYYAHAAVEMAYAQKLPITELFKTPEEVKFEPIPSDGPAPRAEAMRDDFSKEEIPYAKPDEDGDWRREIRNLRREAEAKGMDKNAAQAWAAQEYRRRKAAKKDGQPLADTWKAVGWEAPEEIGNYTVTVRLGDEKAATENFIKFNGRRLASDRIVTKPGEIVDYRFTARVPGPYTARRDDETSNRELKIAVFTKGAAPRALNPVVVPAPDAQTIYLLGDSTVTDQRNEPWGSWGQILPAFVKEGWSCANFARSGLALKTCTGEGRLTRVLEHLKAGDWLLIQFGHNDQKIKGEEPEAGYTDRLNEYIDKVEAKGGKVVLVTPVERRRFDKDGQQGGQTLAGYADAVRAVATKRNVPYIDLNAISYKMMGALGEKGSKALQCNNKGRIDDTHHNIYGAYVHARTIAAGLARVPVVGEAIRDPYRVPVDPFKPVADPGIPPSGKFDYTKPEGN